MGPIWGRQDPGGPHVGPNNFAIWDSICDWNIIVIIISIIFNHFGHDESVQDYDWNNLNSSHSYVG